MSKSVVAIRDLKASAFLYPHFEVSDGVSVRSFGDSVNDERSLISQHPQDYQLFKVGEFDERTGLITPLLTPELLASAIEFVKEK